MALSFLSPELAKWDALARGETAPELVVIPLFSDERPLRGAAGLCDWRLCGRLSRLLLAGRVTGAFGETTLLPAGGLAFRKLVLFGLGKADEFGEERFREAVRAIARLTERLAVRGLALSLPGRSTGLLAARRAFDLWTEEVGSAGDVWLLEPPAAQKEIRA
ncbi:MAG: leucyl aminopeptidase [Myxococcales bacterium]|nr:leucyl aminopeptidase [Myxococcales bacterium]